MDLALIRQKAPADVTADEKAFLAEHKSELTAAELVAYEIESTPAANTEDTEVVEETEEVKEAVAVAASIKDGKNVLVSASEYESLKNKVDASATIIEGFRRKEVKASVEKHVARGAIKADQVDTWTDKIMADASVETLLESIQDNKLVASEIGKEGSAMTAVETIQQKVAEKIKASKEAGNDNPDVANIMADVRRENPELATQYDAEIKRK